MSMMKILAAGLLIPIVLLVIPNVYASESNDKRYSDGYSNGSDAASRATVYDVTCDPNNQFTSGGGHSTTYCNGWINGYNAEWNNLHSTSTPRISPNPGTQSLKDRFCNFVHSGDGAAASALVTLLGYGTVAAAAQALCV